MSAHGLRSHIIARNPIGYRREPFAVGPLRFELCDHPQHGATFGLFPGHVEGICRPLFSGFVGRGMNAQLRALADRCDRLDWGCSVADGGEAFAVGHVLFDLYECPDQGAMFCLIAGEPTTAKREKPLFSGLVLRGMGTQLRRLAHRFDELEANLPLGGGEYG
jgi:hypothetical protein